MRGKTKNVGAEQLVAAAEEPSVRDANEKQRGLHSCGLQDFDGKSKRRGKGGGRSSQLGKYNITMILLHVMFFFLLKA